MAQLYKTKYNKVVDECGNDVIELLVLGCSRKFLLTATKELARRKQNELQQNRKTVGR